MRRLLVILSCAAVMPSPAFADGDAKAKALFEDGRALIEAADKLPDGAAKTAKVTAACDKFAASLALDATLGTKLNLADCRVREGKLADAYKLLEDAAAEAARTHDREAFAKQQLAIVAAKVSRLVVRVKDPDLAGTAVTVGGKPVPRDKWGTAIVVDPGTIPIHATADGREAVDFERSVAAGSEVPVDIVFQPPQIEQPPKPPGTERSKLPYVVIGGGGVLVATSVVLGFHARSRYTTARDANDKAGVTSAQHEADAGTVVFVAGAVAVGVGIYLYVRERSPVAPVATRDSLSLVYAGKF